MASLEDQNKICIPSGVGGLRLGRGLDATDPTESGVCPCCGGVS